MKKCFLKISYLIVIIILLTSGCKEKIYEDNKHNYFSKTMNNVEVYQDVYLNDVIVLDEVLLGDEIDSKDIKIVSENYQIDTTKLGKQKLEMFYKIGKKKYVYHFDLEVVDTTPPLVFSGTTKTVKVGYDEDICNLISFGDNYTGDVKCEIEGDYDLNNPGTYKLVYKLSDSSDNIKSTNVTLKVVKPVTNEGGSSTTPSNPPKKTEFSDIVAKHKNDNTEIGIDVSKWQGKIDFEKVKEAGASFVMIRIGVQGTNSNDLTIDEYYKENIKNAKVAGLKVGVYLYSIAKSSKEAIKHADWVIDTLDGESLDLPIVFDWESWTKWNNFKISFYDINNIANNFMTRVKDKGYEGMLYSSKYYLEIIWTNKLNFPVWLAHYTSKTNYTGKYKIWQLCNDGHIDGINGDVDIDVMYN